MIWVTLLDIVIWGTFIWYLARDERTNGIIFFIMMTYLTVIIPVLILKYYNFK